MENERSGNNNLAALSPEVMQLALRAFAAQNRLLLQAGECESQQELIFLILNHTTEFAPYDRAALLAPRNFKLLGVSGASAPDTYSALAEAWQNFAFSVGDKARIVDPTDFDNKLQERWREHSENLKGCNALWLPLGDGLPCLWLERWNNIPWREKELESLQPLVGGYANLWRRLSATPHHYIKNWIARLQRKNLKKAAVIAALVLLLPVMKLRIVAPCEIVPKEPAAIAAKIDGVVERVLVRPGQTVQAGQELARLEPEVILQERKGAQQALAEAYARFISARSGAINDPKQRTQLPELGNRLRQEQARLALADFRAKNLTITAPLSGVAVIGDPDEWAGKPVAVGERIMLVADPALSRVRIYLPLTDKIDFPEKADVKVILNNDSAASRSAVLQHVSAHATERPGGGGCFAAEADWPEASQSSSNLSLGVGGTAVVYGRRVPLLYWLLRHPLAALRNYCGI